MNSESTHRRMIQAAEHALETIRQRRSTLEAIPNRTLEQRSFLASICLHGQVIEQSLIYAEILYEELENEKIPKKKRPWWFFPPSVDRLVGMSRNHEWRIEQ